MSLGTNMSTTANPLAGARTERKVPRWGGFNLTFLGIELKRKLRNRRTLIFALVLPVAMYLLIGYPQRHEALTSRSLADGGVSVAAYLMVSMATYGAMVSAAAAGGSVAIERSLGWSRQLRLTPLHPAANVATKIVAGLMLGLIAVVGTFVVGAITGVRMPISAWIVAGLAAWLGSMVFTALGLMLGYLVPSENVMQFLGPILAIFALFGGIFAPLNSMPQFMQTIGPWFPTYGIGEISRAPLTGGSFDWWGLVNAIVWLLVFSAGTALVFRRDTKRV